MKNRKKKRVKILSPFPTLNELAKIMGVPRERVAFLKGLIEGDFLKSGLRSKREKTQYIKGLKEAFFK